VAAYAPEGVHEESPTYWDYGTGYLVLLAMGLTTALEDTWGLLQAPGVMESFYYRIYTTGPSGLSFNYGDGHAGDEPLLLHPWVAGAVGKPELATAALPTLQRMCKDQTRDRLAPLAVIGFPVTDHLPPAQFPFDWLGRGKVELVTLRSAWGDPGAVWIALRGGTIQVNHAHMDLGTFVLEAKGVRWAHDLGREDAIYARTDTWGTEQESKRWDYLRAHVHSHNTLVFDGKPQRVSGHTTVSEFESHPDSARASLDLTAAYAGNAERVTRTVALEDQRQHFRVVDEIIAPRVERELRWQMVTLAEVEISGDGRRALLREAGQTLRLTLVSPTADAGARFTVSSLSPPTEAEDPNTGFYRLDLVWPAPLPDPARIEIIFE